MRHDDRHRRRSLHEEPAVTTSSVTIVADTAADALRTARTLVANGCPRLTSVVGGEELRARLVAGEHVVEVLVVDLFLFGSAEDLIADLAASELLGREVVVVAVTADAAAAHAAGADLWVEPGDLAGLATAVHEASARRRVLTGVGRVAVAA